MKTILSLLISSFLLAASCSKEETPDVQTDGNGVIIAMPAIWKKSLHYGQPVSNSYTNSPIYYNGNIVINTTNSGTNRNLTMINVDNGETVWDWDDRFWPATEYIDISYYHQYNNLLTWQMGSRSYCVNLDNGTTQWKLQRDKAFTDRISGFGNNYFIFGDSESMYIDYYESVAYKGELQSGIISEYIIPEFSLNVVAPGERIGDITDISSFFHNGTQFLAIVWQEPTSVFNGWQTYLGLFNFETSQWVYNRKELNPPTEGGVLFAKPVIYQEKIYANVGMSLVCHELMTGMQIWQRDFNGDFMFSGFIIEDGKIIANCEDTFTYCLDARSGNTIWKTQSAGTSSRISYLNGVVYFAGGSSEKLHAIDVTNGKTVWLIDVNRLGESGGAFKRNGIYVIPAQNGQPAKVIALSNINAYCFKAYR